MIFQVHAEQATIQPEMVFSIGEFYITNAMLLGVVVTVCFTVFSFVMSRRLKIIPNKKQTIMEIAVVAFLNLLTQIGGSRKAGEKILPLVGTIFLFFGVSNLIGLIPGLTSITFNSIPLFRTPTNDFNMTFSVALAVVVITQIASINEFGVMGHVNKFIKIKEVIMGFRHGIRSGLMTLIDFAIGLLDIISEIAKVMSLSLRLFGNMYAGEVLAAILLGAFALAIPTVWTAMNVLVGVLQALVFGALTAAYYSLAIQKDNA